MLKRILIPLSILVIIAVTLVIMRETREVVAIASAIHPLFGQVLLWLLLFIYAICLFVPIISFLRLPRGLLPPSAGDVDAQKAYIEKLARRLRSNRNLTNREVTVQSVESALSELAQLAHQRTVQAATVVFVSTAISQSGRLDGLMVMVSHCRLVWQIAHLYWQRPALSDLLALYSNVAAAAFIAQNIEDMDLSETIEPVLAPVLANSVVAAIPGFAQVAALVAQSCVDGTVNAFLTLRVGCLASEYCGSVIKPSTRSLRRTATVQAAGMLGAVAKDGAQRVSAAMWDAAKRTSTGAASGLASAAATTFEQVSVAAKRVSDASGARAAAQFLVQIVVDGAAMTSNAISQTVALKRWWS
jgi:Domain of unknown function (DUF697)